MAKKQPASPLATGGAGHLFEYRIAAIMLAHVLCESRPPGLQVPAIRIGLQQRALGYVLDDIVVHADRGPLSTQFQVKRTLMVTPSDTEFVDVVSQALEVLNDHADEVARGELELGLIAEGEVDPVRELGELSEWARQHAQHGTFGQVLVPRVVKQELRSRLEYVRRTVEAAVLQGAPDLGGMEETTHAFLSAMHVWCPSVRDEGADLRAVLDQLEPTADEYGVTAVDLFAHLEALGKGSGPAAGVVDAGWVRRRLHRRGLTKKSGDASEAAQKIDAEAVVRGPFEALDLQHQVDEAETLLTAEDARAVEAFAAVAEQLRGTGFQPHATIMLRKRADALQAVGRDDEAVIARVDLAWDDLDRVRPWEASFALHDGMRPGVHLSLAPATERARTAADAAVWRAKAGALEDLVAAFDALAPGDRFRDRAAVFMAEEAIAADQPELIIDRLEVLRAIAEGASTGTDEATRRSAIRLRMCLADVAGEWPDLLRTVRRDPWPIVAWVHARYGRFLALSGDGPGAQEHYLDAIEYASAREMFDEAADWLYALRAVRFMYESFSMTDEEHPLAQALRPHAKPSSLPGSPHTAELALHAMHDETTPREALQRAERWRWQAVVRANLADELNAVEAVGTLQERHGDVEAAIESFIRAGSEKKAKAAAGNLSERTARVDPRILTASPDSRETAYVAAAVAGDLLDDGSAREWTDLALDEIAGDGTVPVTTGPALRAFDVLASMCAVVSSEEADRLLALLDVIIERPPTHYRHTDPATAKILLSLASRRPQAVPMLCRAIVADQRMAEIIIARGDVLEAHRDVISEQLAASAGDNRYACLAIIRSGADAAPTIALAKAEVDRVLKPREREPNSLSGYAGAADDAIFASVLDLETRNRFAITVLERALDESELKYSRWNDLAGLFNIAGDIDRETQAKILPRVMEIARGEHEGGPAIGFDIDAKLPALAIRCAARLNPDPDQCVEIERIGTTYLRLANEAAQWHVVQGLAMVPPEASHLDLGQCAVHPIPAMRTLAAIRWAKNPGVFSHDRAMDLARDPDHRVRRELAGELTSPGAPTTSETREVVGILSTDVRRSVRTLCDRTGQITS